MADELKYCKHIKTGVVYAFSDHLMNRGDCVICDVKGQETTATKAATLDITQPKRKSDRPIPIEVATAPAKEK